MRVFRRRLAFLSLAATPALLPLILILHYGVNFHFLDEWSPDIAGIFVKAHLHQLTLQDILAQHNEHRLAIPRLILLAINPITHWNNVANAVVAWIIVCATSLLLWMIVRATQPPGRRIFLWFLCNLLLFTPAQSENWLWGMGLANFTPTILVLATLVVALSAMPVWSRLMICILLASAATVSSGNGVLAWPLACPLLVWSEVQNKAARGRWIFTIWLIACATDLLLYRWGYVEPKHSGSPYPRSPTAILVYTLAFLGNPFARWEHWDLRIASIVIGSLMLLLLLAAGVYVARAWKTSRRELVSRSLPWLMVAGYGVFSGLLASLYRGQFGPLQALSSRYVSYSIFLPIALVNLVPLICGDIFAKPKDFRGVWKYLPPSLASALIVLQVCSLPAAIQDCQYRRIWFRLGKGALLLLNFVPDNPEIPHIGVPMPDRLVETANALNEMGYLRPPLIASNNAQEILRPSAGDDRTIGALDGFRRMPSGQWHARGWAANLATGQPADSIFLTFSDAHQQPIIFAAAFLDIRRDDVVKTMNDPVSPWCGWEAQLDMSRIPPNIGPTQITAWVLDIDTDTASPLAGYVIFRR